jgi:NitT/TauT family transport system permease protein
MTARAFVRPIPGRRTWPRLVDLAVFVAVLSAFSAFVLIARTWLGPVGRQQFISQSPRALPLYAAESLLRISIAYLLSLAFALGYGLLAARSPRAEKILLPLLDILQSIPVLSFLPGVMLAMVAIFPERRLGLELGSILLIFTGQAWNIAFSFYSSMKTIPRELDEAVRLYRFNSWQRFTQLDVPFGAIGLVWNSMMSVAGGWFFLMACEMFVLGPRDFRLPGLGSFLQTAASAGDLRAILWGLAAMIGVIVALDQLVWRPVIAWADKFKIEQVESARAPRSAVLTFLQRSGIFALIYRRMARPANDWAARLFARRAASAAARGSHRARAWRLRLFRVVGAVFVLALGYAAFRAVRLLVGLNLSDLKEIARGAAYTFLRVNGALLLGALWAVPAGVTIGSSPRLARFAQPLAQIAASVPATALFPVVLLVLIRAGGGMGLAALVLMLLGTQWYILFNVIAGAMAIPGDLKEAVGIFRFGAWDRWRRLILPGIFPYLITGLLTASGGAWNASIVAEYFHFGGKTLSTQGLGAIISRATDAGHFHQLLAATIVMAAIVVTVNRLLWQRLYRLAESRFKLEG